MEPPPLPRQQPIAPAAGNVAARVALSAVAAAAAATKATAAVSKLRSGARGRQNGGSGGGWRWLSVGSPVAAGH